MLEDKIITQIKITSKRLLIFSPVSYYTSNNFTYNLFMLIASIRKDVYTTAKK
jgi:hypothetical protein